MPKFIKKPIAIEAFQWPFFRNNSPHFNSDFKSLPEWFREAGNVHFITNIDGVICPMIENPEGDITVSPGNWIVKGVQDEIYSIRNEIFIATYNEVKDA